MPNKKKAAVTKGGGPIADAKKAVKIRKNLELALKKVDKLLSELKERHYFAP